MAGHRVWELSRQSNTLCTSGFVNGMILSHNGSNTDAGHWRIIHRNSLGGAGAKSAIVAFIVLNSFIVIERPTVQCVFILRRLHIAFAAVRQDERSQVLTTTGLIIAVRNQLIRLFMEKRNVLTFMDAGRVCSIELHVVF